MKKIKNSQTQAKFTGSYKKKECNRSIIYNPIYKLIIYFSLCYQNMLPN